MFSSSPPCRGHVVLCFGDPIPPDWGHVGAQYGETTAREDWCNADLTSVWSRSLDKAYLQPKHV